MKLKELFERDPTRKIPRVVKIDQHEEDVIGVELEEYVVTEQIHRLIQDFIDLFIETRSGRTSDVCTWISGFFGSGKSHLAKILGYILTNRNVTLPSGASVRAAEYLGKKFGFSGIQILTRHLVTKAFFYNMINFDRAKDKDLSRYIYRQILRDIGLCEIPWVAEIERSLKEEGLWDKFEQMVKEETGKPWVQVRRKIWDIRPTLVKVLPKLKPNEYPDPDLAQQAIQDQKEEFILGPPRLATLLVNEAVKLDKEEGRIVLILDEVGLYLRGGGSDRLTELNSLAEEIEKKGKGKVWLIATAQEALEEVAPEVGARREQLEWLRDRFAIKYFLDPKNIPYVVEERLLKKRENSSAFKELRSLHSKSEGQLAVACSIQEPAREREIFSRFDFPSFARSYPLLPYHVPLMIDIFASLRAKGKRLGQETKLAGRERAILSVVQKILTDMIKEQAKIGTLITFDRLYDAISPVLSVVSSDYHNLITTRIDKLGEIGGMRVSSVAKALFLLQQVSDWIPTTPANIAAVLYPCLGTDPAKHLEIIEKCLEQLREQKWVKEEEGKYRFLSEVERNFEQEVDEASSLTSRRELEQKMEAIAKIVLKSLKSYNHKRLRVFNVSVFVDDKELYKGGFHKLRVYTPIWLEYQGETAEDIRYRSMGDEATVFWVCKNDASLLAKLRRSVALDKVLSEWEKRARSPQQQAELESYRDESASLEDELHHLFGSALLSGTILLHGEKQDLQNLQPQESLEVPFNRWMERLTENHFTRFDDAAVRVQEDSEIKAVLDWRGGELPPVYRQLKLLDRNGNLVASGPVAHDLLDLLRRKGTKVTGAEIIEEFEQPPFGWNESVLRLVMAALVKQTSVQVEEYHPRIFLRSSEFRKARFSVGDILTTKEKEKARKLISKLFAVDAGLTPQQISETLEREGQSRLQAIQKLKMQRGYHLLPYTSEIDALAKALQQIIDETLLAPSRIKKFLSPEILHPIEQNIKLLDQLGDFTQKGLLDIYTEIHTILRKLKEELHVVDPAIRKSIEELEAKLESKTMIQNWSTIYSQFQSLANDYQKAYLQTHGNVQDAAIEAKEELQRWCQGRELPPERVREALKTFTSFECPSGPEGAYDPKSFLCESCKRSLLTLHYHEERIMHQLRQAKITLSKYLPKEERPTPKIEREETITSSKELQFLLDAISEFAEYWLTKKKKLRLRLEGQVEGG